MTGPSGRRQLVVLCADQLRADALHCYGNRFVQSPHLDSLARRGLRFADHHSVTSPCGPSRASLLTGQYPSTHRVVGNRTPFPADLVTLPQLLDQAGIGCQLIGYTDTVLPPFLGGVEGVLPGMTLHTHFNLNEHGLAGWRERLLGQGYQLPADPLGLLQPVGDSARALYGSQDSDSAFIADAVLTCVEDNRDEDFLIFAAFLRPHPPFAAPAPYDTLYNPKRLPMPLDRALIDHPYLSALRAREQPEQDWRQARAVYYGLVTELDQQVGRVLNHLDQLGLGDQVSVLFTADHGDLLGDLGLAGSRSPHYTASQVPLLVAAAGLAPGVVSEPTESVDVAPTVLALLGLPPQIRLPGQNLLKAQPKDRGAMTEQDFRDFGPEFRDELGLGLHECGFLTWRTARWTAVHFTGLPPLLFDRRSDQRETANLAGRPGRAATAHLASVGQLLSRRLVTAGQERADLQATPDGIVSVR